MRSLFVLALLAGVASPLCAQATTVSATLIPDGTYVAKVEKVDDAQHVTVKMSNGIETTLEARGSVNFSKIKAEDTIKLSVISGKVPVFQIQ